MNARFAEMLGYTPQEMLGMQPRNFNAEMKGESAGCRKVNIIGGHALDA